MSAFDGPAGTLAAVVMARMNADMEQAGLERLTPRDGDHLLVIGFGPGVGLIQLLQRCRPASVVAVDPSGAMVRAASRRLRRHSHHDTVQLIQDTADHIELAPDSVDGAIAVNTHQLWQPHLATAQTIARALRPGARLVTVTHEWAIKKNGPVSEWTAAVTSDLIAAGFNDPTWNSDNYRSGRGLALLTDKR